MIVDGRFPHQPTDLAHDDDDDAEGEGEEEEFVEETQDGFMDLDNTAEDFGALGATDRSLHEFDGEVTRCRVDTGRGVRITGGVVGVHPNRLPARPQLSSRIQGGG